VLRDADAKGVRGAPSHATLGQNAGAQRSPSGETERRVSRGRSPWWGRVLAGVVVVLLII